FVPALLKPAPRQLLHALGIDRRPLEAAMPPVIGERRHLPAGYRRAGSQAIRVDLAEKILRAAFDARAKVASAEAGAKGRPSVLRFTFDLALPISVGLEAANIPRLLGSAGFRRQEARPLAEGAFGPPAPDLWTWQVRRDGGREAKRGARHRGEGAKQPGKGKSQAGGKRHDKPPEARPTRKTEYGPARAGGAFDALKALLR
ncbi:MAG TPA: helicase, partial [Erythrobacter sp.]|nr:helicase [Erythrobacter sp.]